MVPALINTTISPYLSVVISSSRKYTYASEKSVSPNIVDTLSCSLSRAIPNISSGLIVGIELTVGEIAVDVAIGVSVFTGV